MLDKYVKKFLQGDVSSFDKIYELTRKTVYFVAVSILKDRNLAEDVMQTTYLKVIRNIQSYKIGTNAVAWIVKIAKNEAINLKKVRIREELVDEKQNEALFGVKEPDKYGELIDLAKRILDDEEFLILMLVTASGYKRREIAIMLDIPISTVTWKYNNALKKLRDALKKEVN